MRPTPALLLAFCTLLVSGASRASPLDRDRDPVILVGAQLPRLLGRSPSTLVAFRYQGGWVQIPVQTDERDTVSTHRP